MPPKKVLTSTPKATSSATPAKKVAAPEDVSIEDHVLPRTQITRLVKNVLPESTHLQKDAVTALQQASVVFVNFLCAAANAEAHKGCRKNIDTKDILGALGELEYGSFQPVLEAESRKWSENTARKKDTISKAKDAPIKPREKSAKDENEPATKKARIAEDVNGISLPEEPNEEPNDLDAVTEAESDAEEDDEAGASTSPEEEDEEEDEEGIPDEVDVLEEKDASPREDDTLDDTLDDGEISD